MKFDLVLTNPPFQDTEKRGKTPHKLWIDFTRAAFDRFLVPGGILCQVSPSSFRSPSSKILGLMKVMRTAYINFDTGRYFPEVGSTFADYLIYNEPDNEIPTIVTNDGLTALVQLDGKLFYLPNDPDPIALSIHNKVIFEPAVKLVVEKDYVTCHNILLRISDTLSKTQTAKHIYPAFHTNRQIWWSSIRQEFSGAKKVMWTRSGYTKPFFDNGYFGGTDMAYFVRVKTDAEGQTLAANMNLKLMRYIYATAKWSGFGNEKVFAALPDLPTDRVLTDDDLYALFDLTDLEVAHVRRYLG